MLSVWRKPDKVNLSQVWGRFSDVTRAEIPVEYELRLLDEEWKDKCMELLDVFIKDDPLLKCLDLPSDSKSVFSLKLLIQKYLAQNIAVGCFLMTPGPSELVAVDVIHVRTNNDSPLEVREDHGEPYKRLVNILQSVNKRVNIFKHYGVMKFLSSFGILTDPEYKTELMVDRMLETRKSVSAALGIDAVASLFTEACDGEDSLEKLSKRSEYEVLAEFSSEDIQEHCNIIVTRICGFKVLGLFVN